MSLLMKALANAEKQNHKLSPSTAHQSESQQAAANIFTAAQSKASLYIKLTTGLIFLLMLGIAWFSYQLYLLNQPTKNAPIALESKQTSRASHITLPPKVAPTPITKPQLQAVAKAPKPDQKKVIVKSKIIDKSKAQTPPKQEKIATTKQPEKTPSTTKEASVSQPQPGHNTQISNTSTSDSKPTAITIQHTAGKIVKDNTLEKAYQALQAGEYAQSKRYYRQVLKQDVLQTDALLGMAVIAQKQNRLADAGGWFQKALKSDPKNPVALAGLAATKPRHDFDSQERLLKRLIQQQPSHAQHYANLGNLYASQQAWSKAQSAFFEANRHAKNNAQFAFNLAVSLEHLGKPKLAIQHYQRALNLVSTQKLTVPSTHQIQERLKVLQ